MIQDIITTTFVIGAFCYVAVSFGKIIYNSFISNTNVGCGGSCSGCSAKTELLQNVKNKTNFNHTKWEMVKK